MPEGPDGKTIIIIKKVSGHGGHHGGAWKVAYADFVTAMMALFMVLWLVNSAAEPTRQRIANYFRKPGIFQKGSGTPMEMGGGGILPDAFSPPSDGNTQIQASEKIYDVQAQAGRVRDLYDPGEGSKEHRYAPKVDGKTGVGVDNTNVFEKKGPGENEIASEESKLQELKTEIEKAIEESKSSESKEGALGDIEIKVDQRGLVIEIMDTDKVSMFSSGQAVILPQAEQKLTEIAQILHKVSNPIDIEGHTDAKPFKGANKTRYDNWNLSTDRANAARRVLESAGFTRGQIARVVGYADERLKDSSNPYNPSNRRITISMRYTNRAKVALEGKQVFETSTNKKKEDVAPKEQLPPEVKPSEAKVVEGTTFIQPYEELMPKQDPKTTSDTPAPVVKKEQKSNDRELRVEVSTVMPEGAEEEAKIVPAGSENKKPLIFESPDAFFKK